MTPNGGFWWRVLAYLIDAIVLNIVFAMLKGLLGFGFSPFMSEQDVTSEMGGHLLNFLELMGLSVLLHWLYFAIMESSGTQATLGKMAVGLVVTDNNDQRISFGRATGRYFAKMLSSVILGIGYIMVAFSDRKRGLHDILAGTLVYRTRDPRLIGMDEQVFA